MADKKAQKLEQALLERIRLFQRSDKWNKRCADCTEVGPTYVCVNFGTFVCTACSGIHREFNHKVKGVSVSKWNEDEVTFIENHGNHAARKKFMATWTEKEMAEPDPSDAEGVRRMIRSKYENKLWYASESSTEKSKPRLKDFEMRSHQDDGPPSEGSRPQGDRDKSAAGKKAKDRKHKKEHKHRESGGDSFAVDGKSEDPFFGMNFGGSPEPAKGFTNTAPKEPLWGAASVPDNTQLQKADWAAFDGNATSTALTEAASKQNPWISDPAFASAPATDSLGHPTHPLAPFPVCQAQMPTGGMPMPAPQLNAAGNVPNAMNCRTANPSLPPLEATAMGQRFPGDPFNNFGTLPLQSATAPDMSLATAVDMSALTPEQRHKQTLLAQQRYLYLQMLEIQKGLNEQAEVPTSTAGTPAIPQPSPAFQQETTSSHELHKKSSDFSELLLEVNRLEVSPQRKSKPSLDASPTNKTVSPDPFDLFS